METKTEQHFDKSRQKVTKHTLFRLLIFQDKKTWSMPVCVCAAQPLTDLRTHWKLLLSVIFLQSILFPLVSVYWDSSSPRMCTNIGHKLKHFQLDRSLHQFTLPRVNMHLISSSSHRPYTVMVSNRAASKIHFVYSLSTQLGVEKTINSL